MLLLVISVTVVLTVSAFCSLSEAGLYAVRLPYIRKLMDRGSKAGPRLLRFKENIQQPIAAILILNTTANTAGATIAGAQARELFGEGVLLSFTILFTLSVLFFSEIVPKVLGVTFNRIVAPLISLPLQWVLLALFPMVWLTDAVTRALRGQPQPVAPEDEVQQLARISAEEGSILPLEADLVHNVLRLNDVRARDILTPRNVVFRMRADATVMGVRDQIMNLPFARIPVHAADDPEQWEGVVLQRDVLRCIASGQETTTLASLAKPLHFVPETASGYALLTAFLRERAHLFSVLDEFGHVMGVVTLEDVVEALLGAEIVDETDTTVDMQDAARRRRGRLFKGDAPRS